VVLEKGRVTERGTPDELLRSHGYFARISSGQEKLT
jgi:ABC-type multidrug transport system fused ATPase/permease subunit